MEKTKQFELYAPTEARTSSSILILWDKINEGSKKLSYDVYVNGTLQLTVNCTDATLTELEPDTEYAIQVMSECSGNNYCTEMITVKTKPMGTLYNILDFGAIPGDNHVNTHAIQSAIDACEVGGTVFIPAGIFYSGALFLHSNMTLELDEGAQLCGTGNAVDFEPFYYPYEGRWERCFASLLNVRTLPEYMKEDNPQYAFDTYENIAVIGKGVLDGNGEALYQEEMKAYGTISRGRTICIRNTTGLYFYGITVRNSPAWCFHPIYCKNMTINQIKLYNKFDENGKPYTHFNGDGIDPDSCQNVFICHSFIQSQDDSIALKSGREPLGLKLNIPTKEVRITNCKLSYGFGIVAGSEMSGSVNNILIQDIEMEETFCAVNLKTRHGRGAKISGVTYENINLRINNLFDEDDRWFRGIICIDQFYGDEMVDTKTKQPVNEGTSTIEKIVIKNVNLDITNRPSIYMCGLPENHVRDVRLSNVNIKGGDGFYIENVDNINLVNVSQKKHLLTAKCFKNNVHSM